MRSSARLSLVLGTDWTSRKKSAAPQKEREVNLTLGGIDLNNLASVEVKVDKKLLIVFLAYGMGELLHLDANPFSFRSKNVCRFTICYKETILNLLVELCPQVDFI
ncbi:rho GTPase-activating protein 7-like [Silene latifolia]|uniref:rho GTPase-activating protein 7-like n=1 Tax=Silene latifolia TaxID=37657 RepID=UPI003D76F411